MSGRVLIVGGGKVGSHLADLLSRGGHRVIVVEQQPDHAADLRGRLSDVRVIDGSGTDARTLELAGIRSVDVAAAVTGADETNLVVASLARFEFGVGRVIARVVDPRNVWMFEPDMGVDAALDQADLLARLVAEEMSLGEMTTLLKLRRGRYSLVEEVVTPDAPAVGLSLAELETPERCVVVAVIRGGDLHAGRGDVRIQAGDEVLAVVHCDAATDLARLLGSSER